MIESLTGLVARLEIGLEESKGLRGVLPLSP